jgi:hypothetical protein
MYEEVKKKRCPAEALNSIFKIKKATYCLRLARGKVAVADYVTHARS